MWHSLLVPEQCSTHYLKHAFKQGLGLRAIQPHMAWNVDCTSLCLPALMHAVPIHLIVPA